MQFCCTDSRVHETRSLIHERDQIIFLVSIRTEPLHKLCALQSSTIVVVICMLRGSGLRSTWHPPRSYLQHQIENGMGLRSRLHPVVAKQSLSRAASISDSSADQSGMYCSSIASDCETYAGLRRRILLSMVDNDGRPCDHNGP